MTRKLVIKWGLTVAALALYLCWWVSLSLSMHLVTSSVKVEIETGVCRIDHNGACRVPGICTPGRGIRR